MTYGFYKAGKGIREKNELSREKMWARIHLIPLLQAEEDRDQVRRSLAEKKRERELLGGEVRIYHTDRWVVGSYDSFSGGFCCFRRKGGGWKGIGNFSVD